MSPRRDEAGFALLIVLLIVLALAGLSAAAMESLQRSSKMEANANSIAQARWFAIGADAYVRKTAEEMRENSTQAGAMLREGQRMTLPLDAGFMDIEVRDDSRCLNINSVVSGALDTYRRNDTGAAQMTELFTALGLGRLHANELVTSLVAWEDTVGGSRKSDPDDSPYRSQSPAYLTGKGLLADVSELRAIRGFAPDVYETVSPWVCARANNAPSAVNINALTPQDAPLLTALMEGALDPAVSARILTRRPKAGWPSVAAFWAQPEFAGLPTPEGVYAQTTATPDYLAVTVFVRHLDAEVTMTETLIFNGARYSPAFRTWGSAQ